MPQNPENDELIARFARHLHNSQKILAFTGAGMSTGSGIPDFRGPDGLWKKWRPVYYQDFLASETARVQHWEYKLAGWQQFKNALPNKGHQALAQLEREGKLLLLVTQNIDGLHLMAGHAPEKVIELHGTNRLIECIRCGELFPPDEIMEEFERSRKAPACLQCGGFLKPATISFGQQMPLEKMERALAAAREADMILSLGSSLSVEPAASVPRAAKQGGAVYVIVNQGQTEQDALADLRIEGDVAVVLPGALEVLSKIAQL